MQIIKYNISKPKKYLKNNEEKTQWNHIGIITEFHKEDGSVNRIIEIPAIGLEASIFPMDKKDELENYGKDKTIEYPKEDLEEVNPDDIPF